jgi:hypothetical protein
MEMLADINGSSLEVKHKFLELEQVINNVARCLLMFGLLVQPRERNCLQTPRD